MSARVDEASTRTLQRFGAKLALAALLTAFAAGPPLLAMSAWLSVLAWLTAVLALLGGRRFDPVSFNRWDEVLWLIFAAHGLRLAHFLAA